MGALKKQIAMIIAAGPCEDLSYIKDIIKKYPDIFIICADGGVKHAKNLNIIPNIIVGDFDSSENIESCAEIIKLNPQKNDTDTQHCLQIVIERGFKEIILVCATGGRIDHMLSNIFLCEQAYYMGACLYIVDAQNVVMFHGGGKMEFLKSELKKYFSLLPLDFMLYGVTMKGFMYPLENAVLSRKNIISISNEPIKDNISVEIQQGKALLIFSEDKIH